MARGQKLLSLGKRVAADPRAFGTVIIMTCIGSVILARALIANQVQP